LGGDPVPYEPSECDSDMGEVYPTKDVMMKMMNEIIDGIDEMDQYREFILTACYKDKPESTLGDLFDHEDVDDVPDDVDVDVDVSDDELRLIHESEKSIDELLDMRLKPLEKQMASIIEFLESLSDSGDRRAA